MKRTKSTDAPWTLKELRDAKARVKELEAEREKLIRALKRLDKHGEGWRKEYILEQISAVLAEVKEEG